MAALRSDVRCRSSRNQVKKWIVSSTATPKAMLADIISVRATNEPAQGLFCINSWQRDAMKALFHNLEIGHSNVVGAMSYQVPEAAIDNLIDGLRSNFDIAVGTEGLPAPRHENAKVVVDFGDRPDRTSRRVSEVFLFDGNGG